MTLSKRLNQYLELLNCSARELSEASGISPAALSRYRSGERVPDPESANFEKLIHGVALLAEKRGLTEITKESIRTELLTVSDKKNIDFPTMAANFNRLISVLQINLNELAKDLNFDASYLSRIRSGQRRPADPEAFAEGVCRFVLRRYSRETEKHSIADLIGCTSDDTVSMQTLFQWLCTGATETDDYVGNFLHRLDSFDINEQIPSDRLEALMPPSAPFPLPPSRNYYGIEEMQCAELEFFHSTACSPSSEPVFMCSDLPGTAVTDETGFSGKWTTGIDMLLKKGLHLNMIHNIERPFKDIMQEVEAWIPAYMTGQVSPYYLKGSQNHIYCRLNYVSGSVALSGECISGFHEKGKFYLTCDPEETAYYKEKAAHLLSKALPLMDIYRLSSRTSYSSFLKSSALERGKRHNIHSSLPIYTIPEELLVRILRENQITDGERDMILTYAAEQRELIKTVLKNDLILDEICELSAEDFAASPLALSLADLFLEKEIFYTYEEYLEHLRHTRQVAQNTPNYSVKCSSTHVFKTIRISILEGKWVLISKSTSPAIHFVIRHPKMRNALENFIVPAAEQTI
ncbi:MAG: helix-turn-helix transcriptional regulator [Lachnospiraceae bacterium]|nr:helix-turn-helix transcriptional regulator [Lachnospiraceae bacterium]